MTAALYLAPQRSWRQQANGLPAATAASTTYGFCCEGCRRHFADQLAEQASR